MTHEITTTVPHNDPNFKFQVGDKVIARAKTTWSQSGSHTIVGQIIKAHKKIDSMIEIESYNIMTENGITYWADVGCVYKPT